MDLLINLNRKKTIEISWIIKLKFKSNQKSSFFFANLKLTHDYTQLFKACHFLSIIFLANDQHFFFIQQFTIDVKFSSPWRKKRALCTIEVMNYIHRNWLYIKFSIIYWQHIALAQKQISQKILGQKNKNNKQHTNLKWTREEKKSTNKNSGISFFSPPAPPRNIFLYLYVIILFF